MAFEQGRRSRLNRKTRLRNLMCTLGILTLLVTLWDKFYASIFLDSEELKNQYPRNDQLLSYAEDSVSISLRKDFSSEIWHDGLENVSVKIIGRTDNLSQRSLKNEELKTMAMCPLVSPFLVGWIDVSRAVKHIRMEQKATATKKLRTAATLRPGGKYQPSDCKSRNKVAIVVPYRKRKDQLSIFLSFMHPFLQRQQLEYTIFVVEQSDGSPFNRGMLMNIGFTEAQSMELFPCFIFHDIDLLPENDGNFYSCPENWRPRHMAFLVDLFEYKMTPISHFGGVTAFTSSDFQRINGFSNVYWGWGGEDDDLYQRIIFHNLTVTRSFDEKNSLIHMMHYRTLYHRQAKPNPQSKSLIEESRKRFFSDGLINLIYRKVFVRLEPLFTHIVVDIQQKEPT